MPEEISRHQDIKVVALTVIAGTTGPQSAALTLEVDGEKVTHQSTGNGPVDAVINAAHALVPHEFEIISVNCENYLKKGSFQTTICTIALGEGNNIGVGCEEDPDLLAAVAKAYVAAINNLNEKVGIDKQIPAADRYVDLSDNRETTHDIIKRIEYIEDRIRGANLSVNVLDEARDSSAYEIKAVMEFFKANKIAKWIIATVVLPII
ncbi:MAG: alpha-isopropylmalate synthase regulatory domain-containing protein, partial [Methylocystis sp.]